MIEQTVKRRSSSLHLQDIERVLREMVVYSYTQGRKPNYNDFLKSKFEGARYVDDDGVLMDGVQVGRAGSRVARKSTEAQSEIGSRLEEAPMVDCDSTQDADLLLAEFFTDPSVFFSCPPRTGLPRISDRGDSGGYCLTYV